MICDNNTSVILIFLCFLLIVLATETPTLKRFSVFTYSTDVLGHQTLIQLLKQEYIKTLP